MKNKIKNRRKYKLYEKKLEKREGGQGGLWLNIKGCGVYLNFFSHIFGLARFLTLWNSTWKRHNFPQFSTIFPLYKIFLIV